MPTETDLRLKNWLDANQRDREQMCRSILALDPHYSDVRPRHPSGGPDGGRDIEAIFDAQREAYGAVGFHNGANDSTEQKKQIRGKFSSDLKAALVAKSDLKVFAFLTNLHFTMGEQSEMKEEAKKAGIEHCDVLDRERLRIELDSPAGFFVRFQYLSIPLSEAEQAGFLSHYGDRIQEVVSTGFERVERTLNRILFLQESGDVLDGIIVRFQLKKSFPAVDIGHFRAFVSIYLRAVKYNILAIWFGSSDKSMRFREYVKCDQDSELSGIRHGISIGAWEKHVTIPIPGGNDDGSAPVTKSEGSSQEEDHNWNMVQVNGGSSVGISSVPAIVIQYSHDDFVIRFRPRLELRDLNDCTFMPVLNQSLADKVQSMEVFANSYKIADIGPEDFQVDRSQFNATVPGAFTAEELVDPWVRIRPSGFSSAFHLHFEATTPRRMVGHEEISGSRPSK
jgi:hypothetical protein